MTTKESVTNINPENLTDEEFLIYASSSGFRDDDIWFKKAVEIAERYKGFYDDVEQDWDD